MTADPAYHAAERAHWDFFVRLPEYDRASSRDDAQRAQW